MREVNLPESSCPYGYTYDDLEKILGHRLKAFWKWMTGQTMMLCDGRTYSHETHQYSTTACSNMLPGMPVTVEEACGGHGGIVYPWDLERFMRGLPVID